MKSSPITLSWLIALGGFLSPQMGTAAETKEVVFLAGTKSHGYNAHEHRAGSILLAKYLNDSGLNVNASVAVDGAWPEMKNGQSNPDAIVMYCDGLGGHLGKVHQTTIQQWVDAGVGVTCLHFAVEVEPEEMGPQFLEWIGGYFEAGWSVNPHWTAKFVELPEHPITNGVKPFSILDEWYYHMRFQPEMEGVTPILSALPPLESLAKRKRDNPGRVNNPTVLAKVTAGEKQVVAWAYERPNGGRGFGFTGGHFHRNWQQDDFRKTVLNAIAWTAHLDIPQEGVPSRAPTDAELELNQDFPKPN
jgi:type 1 glutamine amidotransferase